MTRISGMPLTPPPDDAKLAIQIRNQLNTHPWLDLATLVTMHGVDDVETLIYQMMAIQEFMHEHRDK